MQWARASACAVTLLLACLALILLVGDKGSSGTARVELGAELGKAVVHAAAVAKVKKAGKIMPTTRGKQKLADVGDGPEVQIATSIKQAVGDASPEGGDLVKDEASGSSDKDIKKIQEEVQAAADKEIDDALKDAQTAAEADYQSSREHFLAKEAAEPNSANADIYPPPGSPGRPAGYARTVPAPTQAQRAARTHAPHQGAVSLQRTAQAGAASAPRKARAVASPTVQMAHQAARMATLSKFSARKGDEEELSDDMGVLGGQNAAEVEAELRRELGRLKEHQGDDEDEADRQADSLYKKAISDLLKKLTFDTQGVHAPPSHPAAPAPVPAPAPAPHADHGSLPLSGTVATSCGNVRGVQTGGVRVFKGIPYALPPTGERRWRPPMPASAAVDGVPLGGCWSGLKVADSFGAVCPQEKDPLLSHREHQSEDCLFLNIYAPDIDSAEAAEGAKPLLPVVFFVHGGGNIAGAGSRYDFSTVAKRGFVAVTVNYRLGALGFLALEELSKESHHGVSGNYGLLDVAMALKWVKRNIQSFGGDANTITLVGQGAGATNALALMISPYGKDGGAQLFHRVLALSPPPRIDTTLAQGEKANRPFAVKAHCDQGGGQGLACLREMPAGMVLEASPLKQAPYWDPVGGDALVNVADLPVEGYRQGALLLVDGHVIPQSSWKAFGGALQAAVPLMIAYMDGEGGAASAVSEQGFADAVKARLGSFGSFWAAGRGDVAFAHEAISLYPVQSFGGPKKAYARMVSDCRLICPAKRLAGLAAVGSDAPVFFGVTSMHLTEGLVIESLSSDGLALPNAFRGRAYAGADSFGALNLLLYVRDEARFELQGGGARNSFTIVTLFDHFARTGTTEGGGHGALQDTLSYQWKPVSDSPNFVVYDSLGYPVHVDVAQIGDGGAMRMDYNYDKKQCEMWARDAIDRTYAASA